MVYFSSGCPRSAVKSPSSLVLCLQSPVAPSSSEAPHLIPMVLRQPPTVVSITFSPIHPAPMPPFSPSEWLCSPNTPVLCSEAPTAQDKGNGESTSVRACSEPVTMAGPHKVHVNNLLTRDVLMSFVTRTLLTSVSKFTHVTNCHLVSAKTSQSVKC